ncbi:MAG: 2-amino-3,7-dideoxy-D-threo-hept-6-ulosonate synthase [Desulfovibrio sp.]|jgi:class I fructose-bisphosphate aldolase|nr:2-amino-3,7-dideoxy-D-threo-hept-6-ulosonate synthase [Desulfovibrio sp.]
MHIGKSIRMERIFNRNTKRCIIVPMDHGVSVGPIPGLVDAKIAVSEVAEGGADAVLMHKGLVRCGHRHGGRDIGLIVHLSGSSNLSPNANSKTLVASVEDALKLGADGVSVHLNIGDVAEGTMLADLGRVASEAQDWGLPLLAMVYARGPLVTDGFDPDVVAHCARVAVELGADIVKVPYCGNIDSFAHVVESCCIPVVIAGGAKMGSTREFLQLVHDSIRAGAAGLSVGRNVFQHSRPRMLVAALSGIVHASWTVEQALSVVGED